MIKNILEVKAPKFKAKDKDEKVKVHVFLADEDTLLADRFEKGKHTDRYAMDLTTGRYKVYGYEDEKWKEIRFKAVLTHQNYYHCYYYSSKAEIICGKGVKEELQGRSKRNWSANAVNLIDDLEGEYSTKKRREKEDRREKRILDLQEKVPPLPADFEEWYFRVSGLDDLNYLVFDERNGKYNCTYCGAKLQTDGIRNLKKCTCPKCGKTVIPRKNRNQLEISIDGAAAIIQKVDDETAVVRHMDIIAQYDYTGRKIAISEAERMFLFVKWNKKELTYEYKSKLYYSQNGRGNVATSFDWKSNPCQRQCKDSFLYPTDIMGALTGHWAVFQAYALQAIADRGICCNIARLMTCVRAEDSAKLVEYTAKLGFNRILREAFAHRFWNYDIQYELYPGAKDAINQLPSLSKQNRNRLLKLDGGTNTLEWMNWAERHKQRISDQTLKFMEENDISFESIHTALIHMTPEQCMNYIIRQQEVSYTKHKPKTVTEQWMDYLAMAEKLEKNMADEMVYRPRELKLRHEQLVTESRQKEAMLRAKESAEASRKRAEEIRQKFPGAEACLDRIREKYEFEDENFLIRVPSTLFDIAQEGYALHHCVSSSDRYYERMEREETYIVFLRKQENPDAPFYTIEVEPGGTIRQHRGYMDEEPELETVKPFLQKWQREVKKKIREEEKDIIDASARLREENLQDLLTRKGANDRVYKALLEDYMGIEDAEDVRELPISV